MFARSVFPVLTNALAAGLVHAVGTRPGAALIPTPTLRLFKNPLVNLQPTMDVADYVEADFSGYAAATVAAWIGPVLLPGFQWALHAEGDFLAASPATITNVCYGYFVTDEPITTVYAAELFHDPVTGNVFTVPFANPGSYLSLDFILSAAALLNVQQT